MPPSGVLYRGMLHMVSPSLMHAVTLAMLMAAAYVVTMFHPAAIFLSILKVNELASCPSRAKAPTGGSGAGSSSQYANGGVRHSGCQIPRAHAGGVDVSSGMSANV
mmetsp:Transcript_23358/g.58623  ORF Transcript_23358/g.58623 Transcript_23358/m.58623 type:complete len:106 (+) Transcript_23358:117-434(+)